MKLKRLIAVFGIALVLLFTLTACDNNVAHNENYNISGEVIDFEGKAVQDAKLSIQDSDGSITVTTNSNGEWKASNLSGTAEIELGSSEGLPKKQTVSKGSEDIDFVKAQVPEITISEDELETIIGDLTSAEFEGRLSGVEGGAQAEDYVNNYFDSINNLKKHTDTGDNYKQPFDHWMYYPLGPSKLEVTDSQGEVIKEFSPIDDFIPLTSLVNAELNDTTQPSSLHLYEGSIKDEYAGDIVLVPEDISATQALKVEQKMIVEKIGTNYDYETLKNIVKNAKDVGVSGVILEDSSEYLGKVVAIEPGGDYNKLKGENPILFKANKSTFQRLEDILNNSDRLVNMAISYELKEGTATSNNIIGYIDGETDENLLIGAHTDHLGFSYNEENEKEYYVGALDNASGTAVLMQLAKYAAENLGKPEKNIIFIGFGGEEINLKGSWYYTHDDNATLFDLNKTSVINMDMIGEPMKIYNAESVDVPMLEKINRILSDGYGLETSRINGSYPSDNRAFEYMDDSKINKDNIVAMGTPDSGGIIHTKQDTPDKLNYEDIKTVTKGLLTYIYNEAY